jgi:hypothetical protein
MRFTCLTLIALACGISTPVMATEVYHWVDENGVSHFTQQAPSGELNGVEKMTLEDTTPPDYDPEEDRYGVAQQQERMAALREERKEKREAEIKRQRDAAARQPVVRNDNPYDYGRRAFWNQPYYPRPPVRPERPIAVPYQTNTLRPPGSPRN